MTRGRSTQKGYSLIEALIAVALLAGLSAALGPALFGSLRISSAVLSDGKDSETLRIVDESLTSIFSNAMLVSPSETDFQLKGDAQALHLVSLAGSYSTARMFELTIDGGGLYGEIDQLTESEGMQQSIRLFDRNVRHFSYYGRPTEDSPLGWRDRWNSNRLPQLVRLEIASEGSQRPVVFDYAIAAEAPLHCAFDPVSRRCRD